MGREPTCVCGSECMCVCSLPSGTLVACRHAHPRIRYTQTHVHSQAGRPKALWYLILKFHSDDGSRCLVSRARVHPGLQFVPHPSLTDALHPKPAFRAVPPAAQGRRCRGHDPAGVSGWGEERVSRIPVLPASVLGCLPLRTSPEPQFPCLQGVSSSVTEARRVQVKAL